MDFLYEFAITGSQCLKYILFLILFLMQFLVIFLTCYYLILFAFGLYRRQEVKVLAPEKTFAIVVAAHNEEAVIGPLVENLARLDYPRKYYDIFVVADNCTDRTAEIARNRGAVVFSRFNMKERGKGYALEWMFRRLFMLNSKHDAIVIFDADNLVKKNYLMEMNSKLCQGHKIIQCRIDSKNPFDTWITNTFSIAFWVTNRLLQLARYNTGVLSNFLGGTGMCIDAEVLKKVGWGTTSLTEDMEFTVKALSNGIKTTWAHDTAVYDEKPLTFRQAWNQRKRWVQGHMDVAGRYFFPLIVRGIKERRVMYLDAAVHLCQPVWVMIAALFMFSNCIAVFQADAAQLFALAAVLVVIQYIYPLAALLLERRPWRAYAGLLFYPVFAYSWIPIIFSGFLNRKDKEWSHTKHSRLIYIEEIVN